MSVLNCRYYDFKCNYRMKGDLKKVVDEFKNHIIKEHKIDYPKEILMQTILRKRS